MRILIKKWWRNCSNKQKQAITTISVLILLMGLLLAICYGFLALSDSYISISEMNELLKQQKAYDLTMVDDPYWMRFYETHSIGFDLIIGGIILSWILHGVGFRIIG